MGRKKNNNPVKRDGVYRVIQQATVKIDGYGKSSGALCLKGLYLDDNEQPEVFTIEFGADGGGVHQLRCFDRFMDAWRSYRRFVCLSQEVSK